MALYRKYRPATFAEVVGQRHVTDPLSAALESRDGAGNPNRINHAYLFSGPRGCGKTSSARIMARSLNCELGPTATPCGKCASCRALAPGGPGNLDVIELDAASHNGVEDMRELREKAIFQPAESRYRIFIIDEAHMITASGFNALLKIVEEPPEHLIFIFATTEPEKVLPTIRSRTHHYPFRLLTPPDMRGLLESVVAAEGVDVEPDVYPLVIGAGGGSPRDSLSVLDQLIAGSGTHGVDYETSAAILGVTNSEILTDAISALAAGNRAELFEVVNRVIMSGQDPQQFALDLLSRVRDLMVLAAVPDAVDKGLVEIPASQVAEVTDQAQLIPPATLTRFSQVLSDGARDFRGVTSPRLLLEVLCARMLLPAAEDSVEALLQRVESLERGLPATGVAGSASQAAAGSVPEATSAAGDATGAVDSVSDGNDSGMSAREAWRRRNAERKKSAGQGAASANAATAANAAAVFSASAGQAEQSTAPASEDEKVRKVLEAREAAKHMREMARIQDRAEREREAKEREEATREREGAAGSIPPADSASVDSHSDNAEPVRVENVDDAAGALEETAPEEAGPKVTAHKETAPVAEKDVFGQVRESWKEILQAVDGPHARAVQVLAAQAVPLELSANRLTLGHSTGALANRLNSPEYAQALNQAVRAVTGADVQIHVVVGTRPRAHRGPASISPPQGEDDSAEPRPKPAQNQQRQPQGQQPESRNSQSTVQQRLAAQRARVAAAKRAHLAQASQTEQQANTSAQQHPAQSQRQQPPQPQESVESAQPAQPARPAQSARLQEQPRAAEPSDSAQADFAQSANVGRTAEVPVETPSVQQPSNNYEDVPPPPEPEDEYEAPNAYDDYSDEAEYLNEADSEGNLDHRPLNEVVIEMLEKELGARRA